MHSPVDLPTVQVLGKYSTHPNLQASAEAWLAAVARPYPKQCVPVPRAA
jgi:hypothetical protein